SPTENKEDEILIDMPKVDENKIPKNSKYDNYEQANKGANKQQNTKYDIFNFGDDNHKKTEDSLSLADDELGFEKRYMMLAKQESSNNGIKRIELLQRRNDQDQMSEELKELIYLQNQLAVQNNELDNTADIQAMLNQYNKAVLAASSNGANMNTGVDSLVHE